MNRIIATTILLLITTIVFGQAKNMATLGLAKKKDAKPSYYYDWEGKKSAGRLVFAPPVQPTNPNVNSLNKGKLTVYVGAKN